MRLRLIVVKVCQSGDDAPSYVDQGPISAWADPPPSSVLYGADGSVIFTTRAPIGFSRK